MNVALAVLLAAYLLVGLALAGIGMKGADATGRRYKTPPWLLILSMTIIWPAPALYVALTRKRKA